MSEISRNSLSGQEASAPEKKSFFLGEAWRSFMQRWRGSPETNALREAVVELIEETPDVAGVPTAERMLLSNIVSLRNRHVSDCMVPRADIVAVEVNADVKQLVGVMIEHAHSRIPVYRETLDEAIGMVHLKDLLPCLAEGRASAIRPFLRPISFVAPSMPASKLLLQMRQMRQHMALVVDEFGGVDGLVTIEDLVEQIVGEIEDEHDDPETPEVITRPDGTLLIDARMTIEDFEKRVGISLSEGERETIDTLAGYVFHLAGHVPKVGEVVPCPLGLMFEILETDQTRIKRVRVRKGAI